ncbi:hypothetical protein UFOVP479_13 [uncultured Caudovirales phage]|uniref:Uncharacterized protein n=2 Tax=uncultured Caudovirales phage TaxID=2100421 RepID=A0A6J5SP94_9CAUD|nr:hypothetical protein UFOVP479_13 [uncultured Caudovirales phage]CAB4176203.1 hypothetical protein UFOVP977_22 [uncultured Caudovirales phage]CAB4180249.1 hypothetical protein UFOVP1039_14 [uncultured Caudovirales phage]CAB4189770.1 hypothetical protein UFOVP1203_18 [uncultured Caudovirales phage]CAB4194330.1 hypothetical protein UFOVP1259_19 [uncultured Caudovirales phage]
MKPLLCKAGQQLREQIDDSYPDRDRKSDGWIGDARHQRAGTSDHLPDPINGIVRAIDVDKDLDSLPSTGAYLADQIRLCAKAGDERIAYVIYAGKIASSKKSWIFRPYDGINRHDHHIHISFTKAGDQNGRWFEIPMLGADK